MFVIFVCFAAEEKTEFRLRLGRPTQQGVLGPRVLRTLTVYRPTGIMVV